MYVGQIKGDLAGQVASTHASDDLLSHVDQLDIRYTPTRVAVMERVRVRMQVRVRVRVPSPPPSIYHTTRPHTHTHSPAVLLVLNFLVHQLIFLHTLNKVSKSRFWVLMGLNEDWGFR